MAKDYLKGDDFKLYLNTGTDAVPVWTLLKCQKDLAFDPAKADIVIEEAGISDGHLQGYGDPAFTFTLFDDKGDTNAQTLITAAEAGTLKELAIANGVIATTGTKYWRLECCVISSPGSFNKGEAASYSIEAKRHANSDNDIVRSTAV